MVIIYILGVEIQCNGSFKLLFALLGLNNCQKVQKSTLEVLFTCTKNHECVNDIGESQVLGYLLLLLYSSNDDTQQIVLHILHGLASTTALVKEIINKGILFRSFGF